VKHPIAIIGGSGVSSIIRGDKKVIGTPYGPTPSLTIGEVDKRPAIFLPRHGVGHTAPPHKVNYRANIWGLKTLGVERIIATNAVGAISQELIPGEIVLPSDLVDVTKSRAGTFYEGSPVTHVDVSQPYCPRLREALAASAVEAGRSSPKDVVMACTEGPRYETPAEIKMLRTVGCDTVGMTGAPEAFLARELELCYASISFVSNMAAGLQRTLSAREVEEKGRETSQVLNKILASAIKRIPESRKDCPCGTALARAQLKMETVEETAE
jgi:5'-methylthioadenosine phosphorylase